VSIDAPGVVKLDGVALMQQLTTRVGAQTDFEL
jgi:hypothetical protein